MNRQAYETLIVFCANQRHHFEPAAWMRSDAPAIDKHTIGFAAQLLSMTSWYGRSTELAAIAESMFPGIASTGTFTQQGKEMGIDLAHFSIAVRLGFWIEPRRRGMGAR